eukprot:TRINITY_DN2773_c0_g2_i1.p1 TRINITY_DN2773_c0_g2~~TRINITY_DN2773_c0_g2_i1.p1  ORF type:complete len:528 (-),score=42.78 TRINITY_DN2773_c0_g2_i1:81-1664(-)
MRSGVLAIILLQTMLRSGCGWSVKYKEVELPDLLAVNLVASPMVSDTQYGLEQIFGNTWSWALNYSLEWTEESLHYLRSHAINNLCEVISSKLEPVKNSILDLPAVIDMDFFQGNLLFISSKGELRRANISVSRSDGYFVKAADIVYEDAALISCNSGRGSFCVIYKNNGELCKLEENTKVEESLCCKINEKPDCIQLLSDGKVVLYHENSINLYNTVAAIIPVKSDFTEVTDIVKLDEEVFMVCKEGKVSIWNSSLSFKEQAIPCNKLAIHGSSLIVYASIPNSEFSKSSNSFLAEYLINEKLKELKLVRSHNIGMTFRESGVKKLLVDEKYAYFFDGANVLMVKHSLPFDFPELVIPFALKTKHFALNSLQSQPYSYETESYVALYEDTVILSSPKVFTPGTLSCNFGQIAHISDLSLSMKLKSTMPDCPEKAKSSQFSEACVYIRNVNITQHQETKGNYDTITIILTIILPVIVLVGYLFLNLYTSRRNPSAAKRRRKDDLLERAVDLASIREHGAAKNNFPAN